MSYTFDAPMQHGPTVLWRGIQPKDQAIQGLYGSGPPVVSVSNQCACWIGESDCWAVAGVKSIGSFELSWSAATAQPPKALGRLDSNHGAVIHRARAGALHGPLLPAVTERGQNDQRVYRSHLPSDTSLDLTSACNTHPQATNSVTAWQSTPLG
jgi:hypothetical protein